jgi:hypothetical protein
VVAVVVPKDNRQLSSEQVLKLLEGRIARFKHPKEVVFVGALPKTALGKIRKEDVRTWSRAPVKKDMQTRSKPMALKIGIDVGGTFTDFVVTRDGAEPAIFKTLSTPVRSVDRGGQRPDGHRRRMNPPLSLEAFAPTIDTIVHGTTVTTNATLTGTGAKCGLLTTEGVRDALEMRRGIREEQYNNRYTNVKPLVPRYLRAGIKGRLDRAGKETTPLDLDRSARPSPSSSRKACRRCRSAS